MSFGAARCRAGGWTGRGSAIAKKAAERLVHRAIIGEGLSDLRLEDDDVRGLGDSPGVLSANQGAEIRALIFGPKLAGWLALNLLHRSSSRLRSPASSSSEWSGSGPVARGSRKTGAASWNETPCFARLSAA